MGATSIRVEPVFPAGETRVTASLCVPRQAAGAAGGQAQSV